MLACVAGWIAGPVATLAVGTLESPLLGGLSGATHEPFAALAQLA